MKKPLPVMKAQCATCPFKPGSKYAYLAPDLMASAMSEASRICHSTGGNKVITKRPRGKARICRGARNYQLEIFHRLGFLKEPTDACWDARVEELRQQEKRKTA